MLSLAARIDEVPLAFLDVETTGLRPDFGDRVCEVAILRYEAGQVVGEIQRLVNPQRPISAGAYAVHGISDGMLRDATLFPQIADDVLSLLDDAVFVGHNSPFDLGFLAEEFGRMQTDIPSLVALDTMRLARRLYHVGSYSLGSLARSLDIEIGGRAHRAMADVLTTCALFDRLVSDLWPRGVRTVSDYVAAQGGTLRYGRLPKFDVPSEIQEALSQNRLLLLRYHSQTGQETERVVRPLGIQEMSGRLFLMAHCFLRDAQRSFRIDRIISVDMISRFE